VPYAVYDAYAVGEVSPGYAARLAARAFRFDVLAEDPALKKIWDVYLPASDLPPSADVLLEVSPSHYIIATPRDVDIVVGDRARRLRPIAADFEALAKKQPPLQLEPRDEVADVVAAVNKARYEKTVRDLVAFGTRYSYSQKCKEAADYVENKLAAVNLKVKRDRYFGPEMKKVAAANRDVAWAAGESGLVARTTDGGARWEVIGPVGEGEATAVACTSADVAWVGQERGVLWVTENGGRIWGKQTIAQGDITDLYFLDNKRGWAVTSGGEVIRTVDAGDSWQRVSDVGPWLRGVSFSDANHGLACGSYGYLARTEDGGVSWDRVGPEPNLRLEAVAHRTAAEAYVVGEGGTVLRSADAGSSWAAVDLNTEQYFRGVDFAGNAGYIVGGIGGCWRTGDGSSWQNKAAPKYVLYSVAAKPPEVVWCGAGGGALLYSPDGGDSWEDQAANADPTSPFVWENVWARQRGRGGAPGTVLVCAHYDSISENSSLENPDAPAPGADDNATGTAAVLELALLLLRRRARPVRVFPLRFEDGFGRRTPRGRPQHGHARLRGQASGRRGRRHQPRKHLVIRVYAPGRRRVRPEPRRRRYGRRLDAPQRPRAVLGVRLLLDSDHRRLAPYKSLRQHEQRHAGESRFRRRDVDDARRRRLGGIVGLSRFVAARPVARRRRGLPESV